MAAVLNVVEPSSTGIGGDAFALLHVQGDKKPKAINGSGFAPKNLTYDYLVQDLKLKIIPPLGILPITVPGAVSAWGLMHEKYGSLPWDEILIPAIHFARDGFPVSSVVAHVWRELQTKLMKFKGSKKTYLIAKERSPKKGEIFKQKALATTLETIAKHGSDEFYNGDLANTIVNFIQNEKGFLELSDLNSFKAEWTEPISQEIYNNVVWEHGPNSQGLVTLLILSIAEELDIGRYTNNSVNYLHSLIEAKKMAFADAFAYIADPKWTSIPLPKLLSEEYAQTRASQINPNIATTQLTSPMNVGNDTVYLTAVDKDGFSISFINSLFSGFGSGIVDSQTGIAFQNRGCGFSLENGHPNQYSPRKRPFHTIIPAMVTTTEGELVYSFGVMGGHHQPQGQAQVLLNLILYEMDPQEALSRPRFHHDQSSNTVALEEPIDVGVRAELRKRGHFISDSVGTNFGGGQVIERNSFNGCYIGGSDPRKDGQVQGY
jgi:gamma-glutamyltranspeptidase/glutathione hydrolase